MATFDIHTFDINKNHVLEASAGTGKTYSIVEIVKKLLGAQIPLEKLLIVTYTEKAAGELKYRIRETLVKNHLPGNIDTANIGTIHSFCQKTIEEFSLSAGKSAHLVLVDQNMVGDLVDQYMHRADVFAELEKIKLLFPAENITEKFRKKAIALLEKYYLDADYKEVPEIMLPDLEMADVILEKKKMIDVFPQIQDCKDVIAREVNRFPENTKANQTRKDTWNTFLDEQPEDYQLKFNRRSISKEHLSDADARRAWEELDKLREKCAKWAEADQLNIRMAALIHEKKDDLYCFCQEEKEKRNCQTFADMLRNVREEVVSGRPLLGKLREKYQYAIIDEFQDTNRIQWDIFSKIFLTEGHNITVVGDPKQSIYAFQGADLTVYEQAKNDILASNGDCLQLDCNYRATGDMVKCVNAFFNNPGAIPGYEQLDCAHKQAQALYAPPSANTHAPTEAFWIFEGEEKAASTPAEPEEGAVTSQEDYNTPEYYARCVCETIVDCCTKLPMGTGAAAGTYGEEPGISTPGAVATRLLVHDKNWKLRNVTFSDFAILAKTRSEMEPILAELKKSGIPFVRYKDTSLFYGRECAHWIALLAALDAPDFTGNNRDFLRKALITDFFGYSLNQMTREYFDKENLPELERFDRWRLLVQENKWEMLIDAILSDSEIEQRLSALSHISSLGAYRQLGEYCVDYLTQTNHLGGLVKHLQKAHLQKTDEDVGKDTGIIAQSTDFDCVKVMTIHASKGLEFPVVVSFAGEKGPKPSGDIYVYHDANDGDKPKCTFVKEPRDVINAEEEAEWQRIYYVAYTRAKDVLILPQYSKYGKKFIGESIQAFCENHRSLYRPIYLKKKPWNVLSNGVQTILGTSARTTGVPGDEDKQKKRLKAIIGQKSKHSSYKHAYSSLSHGNEPPQTVNDDKVNVNNAEETADVGLAMYDEKATVVSCSYNSAVVVLELPADFPAGAGLGNALHRVFELADYSQDAGSQNLAALAEQAFREEGLPVKPAWTDAVCQMFDQVMTARLPEIHGALAQTGQTFSLQEVQADDRKNEVEFNFNGEEQVLFHNYFNGFIDLLFRRGEYYCILDWKSDRLNDDFTSYSDADQMKTHIDRLYSIQRVLYSYCLIQWLKNTYTGLSEQEIFAQHFGGVYYVCLRGCKAGTGNGIYAQTWPDYATLKAAYEKIVKERIPN